MPESNKPTIVSVAYKHKFYESGTLSFSFRAEDGMTLKYAVEMTAQHLFQLTNDNTSWQLIEFSAIGLADNHLKPDHA